MNFWDPICFHPLIYNPYAITRSFFGKKEPIVKKMSMNVLCNVRKFLRKTYEILKKNFARMRNKKCY